MLLDGPFGVTEGFHHILQAPDALLAHLIRDADTTLLLSKSLQLSYTFLHKLGSLQRRYLHHLFSTCHQNLPFDFQAGLDGGIGTGRIRIFGTVGFSARKGIITATTSWCGTL